jgi:WhiB family transcriptional regulator, redox-sensing transcriptional regulator
VSASNQFIGVYPRTNLAREGNWRSRSACRDADPQLFDPPTSDDRSPRRINARLAKANIFCGRCPVRVDCELEAQIERDSGVRGGVMYADGRPAPFLTVDMPKEGAA